MTLINSPIKEDLEHILYLTPSLWEELRGKRIFVTGGTGFFGRWMLESFLWANLKLGLNAQMVVLSRNPQKFLDAHPHLNHPSIIFKTGSVTQFYFDFGHFDFLVHMAATSAEETFNDADLLDKFDTVVNGTRRVLDFAVTSGVKKLLFTSSRAVYNTSSESFSSAGLMNYKIPANFSGAPLTTDTEVLSSWGNAKRTAEHLCCLYQKKYGLEIKIARCFSFIGPGIPLDIHYAVGNFIRDALAGGPIKVKGGGKDLRSYMYMSDLVIWLWTILFKGHPGDAYNVGSENSIFMDQLATMIGEKFNPPIAVSVTNDRASSNMSAAVPYTGITRTELGLEESISPDVALDKTISYYKNRE
jgi:dTDP-glucose 4,6-dehydratase